jgi:hypothetical protein
MQGITLDTGALIALQNRAKRMRTILKAAQQKNVDITVPAVVLLEWWREGFGRSHHDILEPMKVEPTTKSLAMIAGVALTRIHVSLVDAVVMASAAQRGDIVYTSDLPDLQALQSHFPSVRVLSASG